MKTRILTSLVLVALLAGCSGSASTVPANSKQPVPSSGARTVKTTGGPGTTSLTYLATYAPYGPCSAPGLTIMNGYAPVTSLSFAANDGPPLVVSNCHFSVPHYVHVALGTPAYGSPFVRQTDYTVTVDSTNAASVTATWTDLGPTLPGTPGASATVSYTIGDPDTGGGL